MHTVTFYSFKGGVGRTLALVNIGVELANTGRRVLLVDFDLEAPGIDTFEQLAPKKRGPGIVDYLSAYLSNHRAPDFTDHYYEVASVGRERGGLWVMPAGSRDTSYGRTLATIDWQELYDNHEGFLALENLKLQWQETLQPDYVLIDSRTGHTEVGGICTRQLPDTVVVLFIPNEQNLAGVTVVVDAIRHENNQNRQKINIELVASNVPNLDDEHEILRSMMRKFERRLGKREETESRRPISTINRYDSLHLLNQTIFVTERPHSRLAKQYRGLLRRVVEHNLDDREAALRAITRQFPRPTRFQRFRTSDFESVFTFEDEKKIQDVLSRHSDDAEIDFMIGQLYKGRGELEEAERMFARATEIAIKNSDQNATTYELEMIETRINQGKITDADERLIQLLGRSLGMAELHQAVGMLIRRLDKPAIELLEVAALTSLSLSDLDALCWQMCASRPWQQFAVELFRRLQGGENAPSVISLDNVVLAAIGTQNFDIILDSVCEAELLDAGEIQTCFNYGMAKWGTIGEADERIFARVLELDANASMPPIPNYEQCLAVAAATVGSFDDAAKRLGVARKLASEIVLSEFSCWRYLRIEKSDFITDLDDIEKLASGTPIKPVFMR